MPRSTTANGWLRQIAVFAAYTAAYLLLRPCSNGIWAITGGLRLSCLLLLPRRYWPTLALAEIAPLAYENHFYQQPFGLPWAVCNSIPPILYAMPLVWWCKHRLSLFPSRRLVRAKALLACIVSVSAVWTATTLAVLATVTPPPGAPGAYDFHPMVVVQLLLGRYTGILTILPLALVVKLQKPQPWRARLKDWISSPLALESLVLLLPTLAVLDWMNRHASMDARQVIRMAMLLPVAWLTMKHGWRAAAIGVAAAMGCIFPSMESRIDALDVIGTQAFIAFSTTCLLALGMRVTMQNLAQEQEHVDARAAVKLAQQGLYLCELRMRQAAQTLEQLGGTLQLTQARVLDRFKHMLPLMDGQGYDKQMAATQNQVYRLADSMHPTAWRERGLPAALRETIGRTLDEAGIAYHFQLKGRGLSQLSPGVHAAIYRLACEAVVYVFAQQAWSAITISLRGGFTHGRRWAALRVEGTTDHPQTALPMQRKHESRQLAAKLGANSLGVIAMRDYARLYDGELHAFSGPCTFCVTTLVHDARQPLPQPPAAPATPELFIR